MAVLIRARRQCRCAWREGPADVLALRPATSNGRLTSRPSAPVAPTTRIMRDSPTTVLAILVALGCPLNAKKALPREFGLVQCGPELALRTRRRQCGMAESYLNRSIFRNNTLIIKGLSTTNGKEYRTPNTQQTRSQSERYIDFRGRTEPPGATWFDQALRRIVYVFGAASHIAATKRGPGLPAAHLSNHFTKQQRNNERQKFLRSAPAPMKSRFCENKSLRGGGTIPC
jgi:hypothetical protein